MRFAGPLLIALAALVLGTAARAEFVLQLPLGAKETYSKIEPALSSLVPVQPFDGQTIPTERAPDIIRRSVWAFGGEQTISEVQKNILAQLENSDYEILLFCQTKDCGGFDFRFGINVVSEPDMRVDLRDFRFITARQTVSEKPAYVTFLISKSQVSVYVQMTEYAPGKTLLAEPDQQSTETTLSVPAPVDTSPDSMQEFGMPRVLEGLVFKTGSAKLTDDPDNAISALAGMLSADETLNALIVGHSDMTGTLKANISLSQRRARTVTKILISDYGIARKRLSANGVGYLSPRASNETAAGKEKNRRIEVVLFR